MDTIKPLLFFDSCALVKLFVDEDEPATTYARRLWTARKEIYSSIVSVGEVLSVFVKKKECNYLSPEFYNNACEKFIGSLQKDTYAEARQAITLRGEPPLVTSPVIKLLPLTDYFTPNRLSDMAKKHDIEFGDAWHLVAMLSCLSGWGTVPKKYRLLFVSSDEKFCNAVKKEGYEVLDLRERSKGNSQVLKEIIEDSIKRELIPPERE